MSIEKITSSDLAGIGVIGLEDAPGLSKDDMQAKFEETARSVIIPRLNNLIAEFNQLCVDVEGLALDAGQVTATQIEYWNNKSDFSGSYSDLSDKPTLPTAVSELENDAGYIAVAKNSFANGGTISIAAGYSEWTAAAAISALTVTYPETDGYEAWIKFATAASGTVTVTVPESKYIGDVPTFGNSETWEISIKDGIVIAAKCE